MNYNGVGPWNDAVLSLKIEKSRMVGDVLFAMNGWAVDPFLQRPNMISQPAAIAGVRRCLRPSSALVRSVRIAEQKLDRYAVK